MLMEHRGDVDPASWEIAQDAFAAGEFEVAAISLVEDAEKITADEVEQFLEVAKNFEGVDAQLAPRAAAKARRRLRVA